MNEPLIEIDGSAEVDGTCCLDTATEPPGSAEEAGPALAQPARLDGVVIGALVGLRDNGVPLVAFPGNLRPECMEARTTVCLTHSDIGRQVALLFEGGDPGLPLVIGRIYHPGERAEPPVKPVTPVTLDGERLVLRAEQEIVLRCGKASITLTRAGKVLIRGAYILSRSSGANRIKGGSVQVN